MEIVRDDLSGPQIARFLAEHLTDMRASSPACSVHALDLDALRAPEITVWSAWDGDLLVGTGALKDLGGGHGEIKSMRVAASHRRQGIGALILAHLLDTARAAGFTRLSLETGSQPVFARARDLYLRSGFTVCGPFAQYTDDPNSVYLTTVL